MKAFKIVLIYISPLLVVFPAFFLGAYGITPTMTLKILFNEIYPIFKLGDIPERAILFDIRLPRILLAGIVGAILSSAGVTLQGIFRNPLVDPFILGISAGAAFGCALTIGYINFLPIQLTAFIFASLAIIIAYSVARSQGEVSTHTLILSGIIVSAFFTALVSMVKFFVDPNKLQSIVFWLMGSFSLADWRAVKVAALGILMGVLPIYLMRWRLNILSLGDEEAKALGINIKRERLLFITFSSFAVAIATSLCGIIGWVGLIVPHMVRMLIGPDHKTLVPLSISLGATFMITADTLSRTITNFDIPIGIITTLTGAPFFIYLMRRRARDAWVR